MLRLGIVTEAGYNLVTRVLSRRPPSHCVAASQPLRVAPSPSFSMRPKIEHQFMREWSLRSGLVLSSKCSRVLGRPRKIFGP